MNNQTADMTIGGLAVKVGATYEYTFQGLVDPDPANHKARFTVTGIDPDKGNFGIEWVGGGIPTVMYADGRHFANKGEPWVEIVTEVLS